MEIGPSDGFKRNSESAAPILYLKLIHWDVGMSTAVRC